MNLHKNIDLSRTIFLTGLALWITLIAINNLTDSGTNIHLLSLMVTMESIIADPVMGNGLEWRALPGEPTATIVLWTIIAYQILNAALLWRASIMFIFLLRFPSNIKKRQFAQKAANTALTCMMIEWMFFMCGGLFFGYWMKMGAVQSVHIALLMTTLIGFIFINFNPVPELPADAMICAPPCNPHSNS